ncbi:putative isoamylase [Exophiala viscosa]|uniref:Isoamylase n=1 Tax=Exophiala viscosa TaxID=2486360 RepID=A0AAN6IFW0_9EURO|nr:putative isoamylase [Exophiala viscosa]
MGSLATIAKPWWKDAVVYQVWPASFKDTNQDGVGDIRGVIESLDHIQSIGADTVWMCPIYASPRIDFGYDISDYEAIDPNFGTMADVDDLMQECHNRGMKFIMDLVINHTSDQHKWFQESRSSKTNPKRDWYIWRPAKYDEKGQRLPPNNWRSNFVGSAWTWDETTQEYYLHLFAPEQPDLNWDNLKMRKAVYDSAVRFWLEKGIDGFRIDTMTIYSKNPALPDAPITDPTSEWQSGRKWYGDQPKVFEILKEITAITSQYGEKMTVGEFGALKNLNVALDYVGASNRCVGMGFQFETVCVGYALNHWHIRNFSLQEFKQTFGKWQQFVEETDGWTCAFLENHDIARSVSRFGNDSPRYRATSAKMLAILLATSTGTLFLYQGQEIGMTNVPATWPIEEYLDISSQNYWKSVKTATDDKAVLDGALANIRKVARDHARTPMQWSDKPHGGFTTCGKGPWMRTNDNYVDISVEKQAHDPDSVLSFWKQMLALRKQYSDIFVHGTWRTMDVENPATMTFVKQAEGEKALVVLNFTDQPQPVKIPEDFRGSKPLITNLNQWYPETLSAYEGRVYVA